MSPEGGARRFLFVTSNGTGLGHLTRSMAIAKRLGPDVEPLFVTFSAAAPVVEQLGFPVEYIASYDRPGAGTDLSWTFRTRDRLRAIVAEIRPEVVVFDGTHPYERLLPAMRSTGATLVWCRRAMWRADADTAPLHRSHLFDAVLEPGELDGAADEGPTAARRGEAHAVEPIVLLDRDEGADRAAAERELGLEPGLRNVLVQIGQGEGVRDAAGRVLRHLASLPGIQAAALASHLSTLDEVPDGVVRLAPTYPIASRFAAFDAAVSAAGYNAVHELVAALLPALYVPIERQTDDQSARARAAAEAGVGLAASGPADPALEERLDELLDPGRSERLMDALDRVGPWRGAEQAARWLEALAQPGERPSLMAIGGNEGRSANGEAVARRGAPLGVRLRRAWIFASSVPRTVGRVVSQRLRRPRTRVVIRALGLAEDRHAAAVAEALASAGEPAERVLVITDRLDLAPLLAAGAGFEHVPAAGTRQAALASMPYERFRDRRIALIRARRPGPRRTLTLG